MDAIRDPLQSQHGDDSDHGPRWQRKLDFYVNGQPVFSKSGNINYYDMTGMMVSLSGYYGTLKGTNSAGTTCENPTTAEVRSYCAPLSACSPCPIPPSFTRYVDDVIVLKK